MSDGYSGQALTDYGAHALQQGEQERLALFYQLVDGAEISDYTSGVCYDTVGFCMFLHGRVSLDAICSTVGESWVSVIGFDSGTVWQGESLDAGYAVGFKRVGEYSPGYFHAALAIGGTSVRGVNGYALSPGWSVPVDLTAVLGQPDENGQYMYDGQPIEVHYI